MDPFNGELFARARFAKHEYRQRPSRKLREQGECLGEFAARGQTEARWIRLNFCPRALWSVDERAHSTERNCRAVRQLNAVALDKCKGSDPGTVGTAEIHHTQGWTEFQLAVMA